MKNWISVPALALIWSCTEPTSVHVKSVEGKAQSQVFREVSYFSPTAAGRDMEMGTHITSFYQETYTADQGRLIYDRKFDSAMGEGMFSRIAFPELVFRGKLGLSAQGSQILETRGVQTFYQDVIDTMRLGFFIRQDFKRPYYLQTLDPDLKLWWGLSHALSGVVDLQKPLDSIKGRVIAGIKIDSARVFGMEEDDLGNCLHYTLWYQQPDTLVGGMLYLQSLKTSPKLAEEAKSSKYLGALATVKHSIWVDPKTGLLCKEDVLRDYAIQMRDTLKQTRREFAAQSSVNTVYRYEK